MRALSSVIADLDETDGSPGVHRNAMHDRRHQAMRHLSDRALSWLRNRLGAALQECAGRLVPSMSRPSGSGGASARQCNERWIRRLPHDRLIQVICLLSEAVAGAVRASRDRCIEMVRGGSSTEAECSLHELCGNVWTVSSRFRLRVRVGDAIADSVSASCQLFAALVSAALRVSSAAATWSAGLEAVGRKSDDPRRSPLVLGLSVLGAYTDTAGRDADADEDEDRREAFRPDHSAPLAAAGVLWEGAMRDTMMKSVVGSGKPGLDLGVYAVDGCVANANDMIQLLRGNRRTAAVLSRSVVLAPDGRMREGAAGTSDVNGSKPRQLGVRANIGSL